MPKLRKIANRKNKKPLFFRFSRKLYVVLCKNSNKVARNMKQEWQKMALAAAIPLFLLLIMVLTKFFEVGMDWDFTHLGIYPRSQRGVFGIFAHPLVHGSWRHLLTNAFPFLFLGWCLYYFYRDIASLILLFLWLVEGCITFTIGHPGWHVGCSGIIYGLAFFLFFSGLLRRHVPLVAISLLVTFLYGGLVWNMFPQFVKLTTSWEGHLGGAIAGLLAALIFAGKGPQRPHPLAEEEELLADVAPLPDDVLHAEEKCQAEEKLLDEEKAPASAHPEGQWTEEAGDEPIELLRKNKNVERSDENGR